MAGGLRLECAEAPQGVQAEWAAFHAAAAHQHPHQTPPAAAAEEAIGRKALYVTGRAADGGVRATGLFTLQPHGLFPGLWADGYCLSGPVCDDAEVMLAFLDAVARLPAFRRVGRLRVTPYWTGDEARGLQAQLAARGWRPTEVETFRQTGWIDLARPPEVILASFSKSARREVRRAERQGVTQRPLRDEGEARQFLAALNRLHARRGMAPVPEPRFLAEFANLAPAQGSGVMLGAFHEGRLVAGLQILCSGRVAHSSRFAPEPEALAALSNLRIAPFLWLHGMLWARERCCGALDVEGWQAGSQPGEAKHALYKYKGEFAPAPRLRIGEHSRTVNPLVDLISAPRKKLLLHARRLRRRLR